MTDAGEVTRLLAEVNRGGKDALDRLLPIVYDQLQHIARGQLRRERPDHTLATHDLVHEAYLKLGGLDRIDWKGRSQFFAVAARAMRRILVNHALTRRAAKRGGGTQRVELDENLLVSEEQSDELLALEEALTGLERVSSRLARVVECRYFAGLSVEETATALDISRATVKRDWTLARAWLIRELTR